MNFRMQLPFGPHPFPERFPQDTDNTKPSPTQHNPATSAGQGEFEYWSGLPASFSVDNASYKHIATPPTVQENRRPFEDHHMTGKKQTVIWTGLLKPTTTGSCCEDVGDRDSCEQELATWDGYINSTVWDMSYPNEAAHSNDFETWGGLEPALEFSVDSDTRTFSRLSQPSPPSKFSATSADFDATWQKNLTALLPNSLGNAPLVQDEMHLDAPVLTPLQQSAQEPITIWIPFSVFRSSPNLPAAEVPSQIVEVTNSEDGPFHQETCIPERNLPMSSMKSLAIELSWTVPHDLRLDSGFLQYTIKAKGHSDSLNHRPLNSTSNPLISRSQKRIVFETEDLRIMKDPHARLNDTCLNGCSQLLKLIHESNLETSTDTQRCSLSGIRYLV
ncbi:hypothetical protein BJ165DRAFT_1410393 [Panaeolus papilionaceus]|nr:hypothetical protein BJ165DRAFT_1410393 [Panaeolus papilionaceus]